MKLTMLMSMCVVSVCVCLGGWRCVCVCVGGCMCVLGMGVFVTFQNLYDAGVGPAKAITLIRDHRSIEEIIKHGKVC